MGVGRPSWPRNPTPIFPKDPKTAASVRGAPPRRLFGRTVCGVPFARLIAYPERYQQSVIAVTGFLVATGQGRQSLYPGEDSYRNMGEYERLEIGTGVPDAIRAKLGQGVWVRLIGEFDGTYAGQPWGLGAISQVMDIAEARPDVSPVAAATAPRIVARAAPPLQVPVAASSLLPQAASTPAPPPAPPPTKAALRTAEPLGDIQVSPPLSAEPPKVALRAGDAPVASAPPTPLSDTSAAAH